MGACECGVVVVCCGGVRSSARGISAARRLNNLLTSTPLPRPPPRAQG